MLEQQYRPKPLPQEAKDTNLLTPLQDYQQPKLSTIELSEFQNYAIQNAIAEADEDDEDHKDTMLGSARRPTHKDRKPDRISCTYRELARNCRNELGITFG